MGLLFKIKKKLCITLLNLFSFEQWQKMGYHVMYNYYYSPIPDTTKLTDKDYNKVYDISSLNFQEGRQLNLLKELSTKYRAEYDLFPLDKPAESYLYYKNQTTFRCVDAQLLYSLVRHIKPNKIIEIGSGYSTLISAQAIRKNKEENSLYNCNFSSVEPYPSEILKKGVPGLTTLIDKPLNEVGFELFDQLGEGDILFIDSTHTVKMGSDVNYEILEILPRLKKGVTIHVHDIFLPYEYPKSWIKDKRFWAEQYLLHAFLLFNDSFEIIWASHYMHRTHSNVLKESMSFYDPTIPFISSFWIKKVK